MKPLSETMLETITVLLTKHQENAPSPELLEALAPVLQLSDRAVAEIKHLYESQITTLIGSMKEIETQVIVYERILSNVEEKCIKKFHEHLRALYRENRQLKKLCADHFADFRLKLSQLPRVLAAGVRQLDDSLQLKIEELEGIREEISELNSSCFEEIGKEVELLRSKMQNLEGKLPAHRKGGEKTYPAKEELFGEERRDFGDTALKKYNIRMKSEWPTRDQHQRLQQLKEQMVQARKSAGEMRRNIFA